MKNEDDETDKVLKKTQKGSAYVASEYGGCATQSRFNPNVLITDAMTWHSRKEATKRRHQNQRLHSGPTWSQLLKYIVVGVVELLIPLAFIIGMIYWKAPWLFWAVVHFLRGEAVLRF